jgi:hypothetical protein
MSVEHAHRSVPRDVDALRGSPAPRGLRPAERRIGGSARDLRCQPTWMPRDARERFSSSRAGSTRRRCGGEDLDALMDDLARVRLNRAGVAVMPRSVRRAPAAPNTNTRGDKRGTLRGSTMGGADHKGPASRHPSRKSAGSLTSRSYRPSSVFVRQCAYSLRGCSHRGGTPWLTTESTEPSPPMAPRSPDVCTGRARRWSWFTAGRTTATSPGKRCCRTSPSGSPATCQAPAAVACPPQPGPLADAPSGGLPRVRRQYRRAGLPGGLVHRRPVGAWCRRRQCLGGRRGRLRADRDPGDAGRRTCQLARHGSSRWVWRLVTADSSMRHGASTPGSAPTTRSPPWMPTTSSDAPPSSRRLCSPSSKASDTRGPSRPTPRCSGRSPCPSCSSGASRPARRLLRRLRAVCRPARRRPARPRTSAAPRSLGPDPCTRAHRQGADLLLRVCRTTRLSQGGGTRRWPRCLVASRTRRRSHPVRRHRFGGRVG